MAAMNKLWESFSMVNFSFPGFSNLDIFNDTLWKIQQKSSSYTVSVNPTCYDKLMNELEHRYGVAEEIPHGIIFRCMHDDGVTTDKVSIRCFPSTTTLSIQGKHYEHWTDTVLKEIGDALKDALPVLFSDSNEADVSIPFPLTSTPRASICLPTAMSAVSTQTQTPTYCDAACQTSDPTTSSESCDSSTQTTYTCTHTLKVISPKPVLITPTASAPSTCIPETPVLVDCIPTSNHFSVLEVEETVDDDFPPLPLPWITRPPPRKVRKSTSVPVSRSTCIISSTVQTKPTAKSCVPSATSTCTCSPTSPKPCKSTPSTRTVLILGDSIPKHLDGRRMSRKLNVINECVPGIRLAQLMKLAPTLMEKYNPSCVIIHCGTNDIIHHTPSTCLDLTVELVNIITKMNPLTSIAISSLTTQKDFTRANWIRNFNMTLYNICRETNIAAYIDNSNIGLDHLSTRDYLHLKGNGIRQLAKNYIAFLRYFSTTTTDT